jgi:predicted enzyme related to lactoylglutathione lyase
MAPSTTPHDVRSDHDRLFPWHVPDIETKLAEVTAAGATVTEPAHDVGGGRLVATVTDHDGNVLGLLQGPMSNKRVAAPSQAMRLVSEPRRGANLP